MLLLLIHLWLITYNNRLVQCSYVKLRQGNLKMRHFMKVTKAKTKQNI